MFPYPLGSLHMGHLRVYTISDVLARFKRMRGFDVIHPMGWDAFGLPAENAAIERHVSPADWTNLNIQKMKQLMNTMLADFDWDREVNTSSPDYYRWTQKIFLLLHQHGLVYRKDAEINWDPVDKTVLANEQVDSAGRSWRSGAIVEKRNLEQWFIGITKYAKDLNKDLDYLSKWPDKVKIMQKNWIGESSGADISFPTDKSSVVTVFTSRPETLFSVQFLALALNHPLVKHASESDPKLRRYLDKAKFLSPDSKDGFELKMKASIPINSSNGIEHNFQIPIFVAPYVLGSYGHAAVMGCPAHDERDFQFWQVNRPGFSVTPTVIPKTSVDIPYTGKQGTIMISNCDSSSVYNGMPTAKAATAITSALEKHGLGASKVQYRIRDWLISRQRYWGTPIPMIHCETCGIVPVSEKDLPVVLPPVEDANFEKGNPLKGIALFVNTKCPSCGADAKRDTDTMDTFMDSSWYFFRYLDPQNRERPFSNQKALERFPVDTYIGGVEHAILHLLYSRFISKFLSDAGLWEGKLFHGEPINTLITQGMVHGETFINPENGRFLKPHELVHGPDGPKIKASDLSPKISFEKMSKSKYNGADPISCIEKYGADATRAHMLFQAPISDVLNWNEEQIVGSSRWLQRVLDLQKSVLQKRRKVKDPRPIVAKGIWLNGTHFGVAKLTPADAELYNEIAQLLNHIKKSMEEDFLFNTVVSDLMKMTNAISAAIKTEKVSRIVTMDSYKKLLVAMAPVAPCTAEEAWERLRLARRQAPRSIFHEKFPEVEILASPLLKFNVFVNGKIRGVVTADKDLITQDKTTVLREIKRNLAIGQALEGLQIDRIILKPRMIGIVTCK